jgi:hypothetical protein
MSHQVNLCIISGYSTTLITTVRGMTRQLERAPQQSAEDAERVIELVDRYPTNTQLAK